jgi:hypothetical protein
MWEIYGETFDGQRLYARVDDDGLIRVTAIEGHPELDEWLKDNSAATSESPEAE